MKKMILMLVLAFGVGMAESESYEGYLEKGNKAFLAQNYKQAETYYKKACEKAPNNDYSDFAKFRQNCNAHTSMEYFGEACSNGHSSSYYADENAVKVKICMQIGNWYYDGNKEMGVEKNIPLAKRYWNEALNRKICYGAGGNCESGWWSESDVGFYYTMLSYLEGREKTEYQKEIKKDYTRARLLAEIACENDEPIGQACEILGDIYIQGKGVKQDLNKAKTLYQKACENPRKIIGVGRGFKPCGMGYSANFEEIRHFGCKKLGDIYYLGKNFTETKKWWAKAFYEMYESDVKLNNSSEYYYQEAEGYYNGFVKENKYIEEGTYIKHEQDYTKAFLLADIGCNEFKDFKSCSILVNAYTQGKGTKQNLNLAQHYLTKANQYEAKVLYHRALDLEYEICDYGDGEVIGLVSDEPNPQAVAKQRVQIKELLQKACNLDKSNQACIDLKNKSYEKWKGF